MAVAVTVAVMAMMAVVVPMAMVTLVVKVTVVRLTAQVLSPLMTTEQVMTAPCPWLYLVETAAVLALLLRHLRLQSPAQPRVETSTRCPTSCCNAAWLLLGQRLPPLLPLPLPRTQSRTEAQWTATAPPRNRTAQLSLTDHPPLLLVRAVMGEQVGTV